MRQIVARLGAPMVERERTVGSVLQAMRMTQASRMDR